MVAVDDPTSKDEAVLTDNFYGRETVPDLAQRFTGDLLPHIPVSRIPSLDPSLISALVERGPTLRAANNDCRGVSAEVWQVASKEVFDAIQGSAEELILSPPQDEPTIGQAMRPGASRLYFNVHGSDQEPVWVGESKSPPGEYPLVLTLDTPAISERGIVVSEACYGAMIFPDLDAGMGERFLRAGAGCFIGSTIVAWGGSYGEPPRLADHIALYFFDYLDRGHGAAESLLLAKKRFLNDALESTGAVTPQEHNTLLSFVHYGLPLAAIRDAGAKHDAVAPDTDRAFSTNVLGSEGSALDRVRRRLSGDNGSVTDAARQRMASRLSPSDWKVLSAGRQQLAQLSANFRTYAEISSTFTNLLGQPPQAVDVFRYRAGSTSRSSLTARVNLANGVVKLAALVLDENERICSRSVSR